MTSGSHVQRLVVVSVIGVGLVGSELVDQLRELPSPGLRDQFHLLSLSSSRSTVNYKIGSDGWSNWRKDLAASSIKTDTQALVAKLVQEVAGLREGVPSSAIPVLVDNTSSEEIARLYPFFLSKGINIVTPNKKAFSSELTLYDEILAASLKTGARFYNESTVGAGLPIISTIKDLVATGDKVRSNTRILTYQRESSRPLRYSVGLIHSPGYKNRRRILRNVKLHFQRVLRWEEPWERTKFFFYCIDR